MAHLSDLLSQRNLLTSKVGRDLDGTLRQLFEDVGEAGEGAPQDATYIVQTADAALTNAQALDELTTGYAVVTNGTGVVSTVAAIPDADVEVNPAGLTNTDGTNVEEVISDFDAAITAATGSGGPPSGPAGGVLSGTYPNPGFAVDMATQAELDAHINDSSDAHDASAISIADAGDDFTATDVEGALAELQSDHEADAQALADHLADTADAHDASAVSYDNATAGLSATDAQAAIDELSDLIAGLSGQPADTRTGLVHGGQVIWETGLQFRVSHAIYYILGTLYESAEQTITLDAADADNDRIDVIGLDTTETVFKVTGTAAANPSEPSIDPETQLKLAVVIVPEDATSPSVTNTDIYLENTEWTTSVFDASINPDSTNNPRTGTKCVEATTAAAADWVQFDHNTTVDLIGKQYLVLYLRSKATWPSTKMLRARFQLAGVVKGVEVTIRDGYWGFDSSITASYQQVAIPLSQFQVPASTLIDELRVTVVGSGGAIGWYMDDVFLQAGVDTPIPVIPYATTTTPGIVELATDGENAANVVVQGNDARLSAAADLAAHLADTSDAHDASAISILDTANDFTATDVEGALAELQSDHEADSTALSDHIADTSDAHDASAISVADSGGHFSGSDVEAVLAEAAVLAKSETLVIACSDETTDLTTGTAKVTFRMPWAFTVTAVRASVTTAPTGANLVVDINESGSTILSTKLSIDASEKTSTTAATPAVISDSALADDAEITIDIDQIGSTIAGAGLKVTLIGTRA